MFWLEMVGQWAGNKWFWQSASESPKVSRAHAAIVPAARGKFVRVDYTWAMDASPQEGTLLVGFDAHRGVVSGAWIDSWHMSDRLLTCTGNLTAPTVFAMSGTQVDPPAPDRVWSITFERGDSRSSTIRIYNVSPEGHKDMFVEAIFKRGV
jgi:Protein of unknown function (DUF1579)